MVSAGDDRRLGRELILRSINKVWLVPVLSIGFLFFALAPAADLQLSEIIEKIYESYRRKSTQVESYICTGSTYYQEFLSSGELEKEIFLIRRLYTKGTNQNYDEYLKMTLNGRLLSNNEMDKQIEEWNRRGKKRGATNMPLRPATTDFYDYSLLTDTVMNGYPVYRIGFMARPGIDNVINGTAYVDRDDLDIIRIEASPVKLPGVIRMMKMIYHYTPVEGHMLPDSFRFEMKIKVKFLINFYDRYIKLTDVYSDYRLNADIPDTLFLIDEK